MNVIISNKNKAILDTLQIDVIKRLDGEFEVEDIISQFKNLFYQRMILDVTALKNYRDIKTLQKLSIALDMDKTILLLDETVESKESDYLSKLISMGIYNFTTNVASVDGLMYLYNNPNSYRDVAHIQQLDNEKPEEVVVEKYVGEVSSGPRVIGLVNITKQTGATTLAYMMKKQLSKNYKVIAIEIGRDDFKFFNDKSLKTSTGIELGNMIARNSNCDAIIIDTNDDRQALSLCDEVLYLVEPSMIKLNKLMVSNPKTFVELRGKNAKIVLNQSMLSKKDVLDFEYEANAKVFFNMPPLDEREKSIYALNSFLTKMGFAKQQTGEQEKKKSILAKLFGK